MMNLSLKQILKIRNGTVALTNAGVTWIVLIIAPLGLFAVILCTFCVFFGSLSAGYFSDRLLCKWLVAHYQFRRVSDRFGSSQVHQDRAIDQQQLPGED